MHIIFLVFFLLPETLISQVDTSASIRVEFNNISEWENIYFSVKKVRTDYQMINDGNKNYLQIKSDGSASGLKWKREFKPHKYPVLRWKWRVDSLVENSDGRTKDGDDYAVRIFILFAPDSSDISFWQEIKNTAFSLMYGYDPPHSALILVWANIIHNEEYFQNPYSDNLVVWNMHQGTEQTGIWLIEEINIIDLYKKAFGKMAPEKATLAIMGDSDNSGKSSLAFIDYIEISCQGM